MEVKTNRVSSQIGKVPFTTKITTGTHTILSDEPPEHGGADMGMKPHDLVLAGLASCTCITIKMYADRKGWKVEQITSEVLMERFVESGIQNTRVVQTLTITGNLDDTMKNRLVEIGSRCPVHKTLSPAMTIETLLKR